MTLFKTIANPKGLAIGHISCSSDHFTVNMFDLLFSAQEHLQIIAAEDYETAV